VVGHLYIPFAISVSNSEFGLFTIHDVYAHWIPGQFKSEVDELDQAHPTAPQAHPETNTHPNLQ